MKKMSTFKQKVLIVLLILASVFFILFFLSGYIRVFNEESMIYAKNEMQIHLNQHKNKVFNQINADMIALDGLT